MRYLASVPEAFVSLNVFRRTTATVKRNLFSARMTTRMAPKVGPQLS
jgi:hypothetical protein